MRPPLSNVTINTDGVGFRSAVLVDGFPIIGVTAIAFDIDSPTDLTRARIDVVGIRTGERVELDTATPIYDQLVDEMTA